VERSFAQEMAGLPRAPNFSVLELKLYTEGHVWGAGALVLEVLMICPPVQTLKLELLDDLVILFYFTLPIPMQFFLYISTIYNIIIIIQISISI
jgi:hypothetical protein